MRMAPHPLLAQLGNHAFGAPVLSIRPPDLSVSQYFNAPEGNMMARRQVHAY